MEIYLDMVHHERSLSPIPRPQGWACGPSAFLYIPKDYLLDYFFLENLMMM